MVASLTRRFGDLEIAEEAAAEAFATAVERWPADGLPPNPGVWLTTTVNRKAIDRIRRENKRDDKQKEAQMVPGRRYRKVRAASKTLSHTAGIPPSSAARWVRTTTVRSREGRFDHDVPKPPSHEYLPSSNTDTPYPQPR